MVSKSFFLMPSAESYGGTRADLSFGLRSAVRYYNEIVVPGIAGVRLVRQLSWAVAALRLRERLAGSSQLVSAIKIANGIEALGCKLEWNLNHDDYSRRGVRAFNRNRDTWTFKLLSTQSGYVQIPYRMSTVRALPEDIGLGFTSGSSSLFNQMYLSQRGKNLADAILQGCRVGTGNASLESFLVGWIKAERNVGENASFYRLYEGLGPGVPTDTEKETVHEALKTVAILPGDLTPDPDRRLLLVDYFSGSQEMNLISWLENTNPRHALQINVACAFDAYREALGSLFAVCTSEVEVYGKGLSLQECASRQSIMASFSDLEVAARSYLAAAKGVCEHSDANTSANSVLNDGVRGTIEKLVMMDDRILSLADGKICRGALFRNMLSQSAEDDAESSDQPLADDLPHHRLMQLRDLLENCEIRGGNE